MERMRRRWSNLTPEDVQMLADSTPVEKYSKGGFADGPYRPAESNDLTGKKVEMNFSDGTTFTYNFLDINTLVWSKNGGVEYKEFCQIHHAPCEEQIYFINHYCKGSRPPSSHCLILDFDTGLVTACIAQIGVPESAIEVKNEFLFGRMKGNWDQNTPLHDYTTDLIGKAKYWTYIPGGLKVKHIYSMPMYYTYSMIDGDKCWMASNPADYIKINGHMYVFSFVEERQTGLQAVFLINLDELHDVGAFFGVGIKGLSCKTVGAKGKYSTMYTLFDEDQSDPE